MFGAYELAYGMNKLLLLYLFLYCFGFAVDLKFRIHSETDSEIAQRIWYKYDHGIYIRWYLIDRCARKEQSPLFDLYKAFD